MTNKKQKNQSSEPFEVNYERMTNPVKKLLAGIKKEDLDRPIDEDLEEHSEIDENSALSTQSLTWVEPTQVNSTQVDITPVETTRVKSTQVTASKVEIESNFTKVDNDILDKAIMSLTASEFIAYLKLYRLSYGFRNNTCRIGRGRLSKICNLKSDKTVQVALTGLEQKGYIKAVEGKENNPRGTLYRIFLPQEVDNFHSSTRVKFTQVEDTQVKATQVEGTQVKTTRVENKNNLGKNYLSKKSVSFKEIDHDLKKENHHQNTQPNISDHEKQVMMIYEQITGNNWTKVDTTNYQKIKNVPIDKVEVALRLAYDRATNRPNSFAFFIKEIIASINPKSQSRSTRKKAMQKIVERIRNSCVGSNISPSEFVHKVKELCLREDVAFENDLFEELMCK